MIGVGIIKITLDDWGSCKNYYMWNPTTCDCKSNKTCKINEFLDNKNCSCKKRQTCVW